MKPPAFQFYAAEYLADEHVQLMTLEEEGAYIRLLAYCWREGSIPNDAAALSKLCKGGSTTVIEVVMKRFTPMPENSTRLIHPRLEMERLKQSEWREKSAEGGRASAGKRKNPKKISAQQGGSTKGQAGRLNQRASGPVEPKGNSSSSSSSTSSSERDKRPAEKRQDERSNHPAIVAVRDVKGRFPNKDVWDLIIEKIGAHPNVPKMRECWVTWRSRNYAPENLGWLVDWYLNGMPGGTDGKHRSESSSERNARNLRENAAYIRGLSNSDSAADSEDPPGLLAPGV